MCGSGQQPLLEEHRGRGLAVGAAAAGGPLPDARARGGATRPPAVHPQAPPGLARTRAPSGLPRPATRKTTVSAHLFYCQGLPHGEALKMVTLKTKTMKRKSMRMGDSATAVLSLPSARTRCLFCIPIGTLLYAFCDRHSPIGRSGPGRAALHPAAARARALPLVVPPADGGARPVPRAAGGGGNERTWLASAGGAAR